MSSAATEKVRRHLVQVQQVLRRFGRRAAAHGVISVAKLPDDAESLTTLLTGWGLDVSARNHTLWVLRTASGLLADDDLGASLPARSRIAVGAQQSARIEERLPGLSKDIATWQVLAASKVGDRAPGNRSRTAHTELSPVSINAYRAGIRRWSSALLTLVDAGHITVPVALEQLDVGSLWLTTVEASATKTLKVHAQAPLDERRARKGLSRDGAVSRVSRPLALGVIDLALDHGLWTKARRRTRSVCHPRHVRRGAEPYHQCHERSR